MPSNQSPLGALPTRFRRQRVLLVGCGDVGLRMARELPARVGRMALTSTPARVAELRARGIVPLRGDLDQPATVRRLAGLAHRVVHLVPPPNEGHATWWLDPRTRALLQALRLRTPPAALVYASTTGVYGDCGGQRVAETWRPNPSTPRAQRRRDAERQIRHFGRAAGGGAVRACILRVPGIYATDRPGGTPRDRLLRGTPVLQRPDDVYTNHIQADDLARAALAALWRGRPQRIYNVSDDTELRMGDYFDLAADLYGLTRPPRVPRDAAAEQLPLMLLSFMSESRLLDNRRMKRELRLSLKYPTVREGLRPAP